MAKRLNPRKLRGVLTYTVPELARALGVTNATVRAMIKRGMPVLAGQRPTLILGEAAQHFISSENDTAKKPLASDQLFCLTCKFPTRPLGAMVDLVLSNSAPPRLVGLCQTCEGTCSRVIARDSIDEFRRIFDIAISSAKRA